MRNDGLSRRRFVGSLGLAAAASVMTKRASSQEREILNVGASPFINQGTVFIANELGFFSKLGLEVRLKSYPDGALIVAPMLAGEIDIGALTCSAAFFNSLSRGGPYRAFLCLGQGRPGRAVSAIVVRADHYENGLRSIKDLVRLKAHLVAVGAAGSINQYSMSSGLALAGLNPAGDVTWQTSVEQPDIVKQLGNKQIDAAELTYHLAYLAQKQDFARIVAARDEVAPNSQTVMLTARDELFTRRRAALVRFAMAHIHAARLFNKVASDPASYDPQLQMITKHIFLKDVNILKAVAPHWDWVDENGKPNVESVLAQQELWANRFKLVERPVSRERIFNLEIAEEATRRLEAEKPFG